MIQQGNNLNYQFIDKIKPARVAFAGILFYLIVFIITPAHVSIHLSITPFVYVFLGYIMFFAGTYTINFKASNFIYPEKSKKRFDYLFAITIILSIIGITLRLYDRLFIRGASLIANMYENREALDIQSAGPISFISTILFPLVYFNFFWLLYRKYTNKVLFVLCTILFFFPVVDAIIVGSRFSIFHNVIMLFLILRITNNLKLTWKKIILIIAVVVLLVFLIANLLEQRLAFGKDEFNFDFTYVLHISEYNFTFEVNKWYENFINIGPNTLRMVKFVFVHIGQYIVHGLLEFNYLYTHYNIQNQHSWGGQIFYVYFRVIPIINTQIVADQILMPRIGVYISFFGDVFVDFGWWGMMFMFFFGISAKFFWTKIKEGKVIYIPMYLFLVFVMFFMPTVNLISSAMGLIYITSLFIPVLMHFIQKEIRYYFKVLNPTL